MKFNVESYLVEEHTQEEEQSHLEELKNSIAPFGVIVSDINEDCDALDGKDDLRKKIDSLLKKKEAFDKDKGPWDMNDEERLKRLQKMYRRIHRNESVSESINAKKITDKTKDLNDINSLASKYLEGEYIGYFL